MPSADEEGINPIKVHPEFLESNATSHTWAFAAFAELIDNSYDAKAKEIQIDQLVLGGARALSFQDDGFGMDQNRLYKMLSFGYCDKDSRNPVGMYGNGFKSGAMRLGKDAIVFTRTKESAGIGLLSQTYLKAINAETVRVPMLHYSFPNLDCVQNGHKEKNLKAILQYSPFTKEEELLKQLKGFHGTGTLIVIYNLRKIDKFDRIELDFTTNPIDIMCPQSIEEDCQGTISYRNSLREYCSILFLHPKMKIKLRGNYVKTRLIDKSLRHSQIDEYTPKGSAKSYQITFGKVPESEISGDYGIMLYRDNRLIKPYEKITYQRQNDGIGVGIVGVTDACFLTPTHNKQDFVRDDKFNNAMMSYGIKLRHYWNYVTSDSFSQSQAISTYQDTDWVQCDNKDCLKWRRLPHGFDVTKLQEKWYCFMHPNDITCNFPEDVHYADEEIKLTAKKKRLLSKRRSVDGSSETNSKRAKKNGSSSKNNEAAVINYATTSFLTTSSPSTYLPTLDTSSNSTTEQSGTLRNSDRQQSVIFGDNRNTNLVRNVDRKNNDSNIEINKSLQCCSSNDDKSQVETFISHVKKESECSEPTNQSLEKNILELQKIKEESDDEISEMIDTIDKEQNNIIEVRIRLDEERRKNEIAEIKTKLHEEKRKEIGEITTKLDEEKKKEIFEKETRLYEEKSKEIAEIRTRLNEEKKKEIDEIILALHNEHNNEIAVVKRQLHDKELEASTILTRLDYFCNKIRQLMRRLAPHIPIGDDADIEQLVDDMLEAQFVD